MGTTSKRGITSPLSNRGQRLTPSQKDSKGHFTHIHCEICGAVIDRRRGYKARNTPMRCIEHWPDSEPIEVK